MSSLSLRDRELVALGAAMGSNCVPCVEYHIPESRKAGLTDDEIRTAIHHADKIRQVPARRTLEAALDKLGPTSREAAEARPGAEGGCGPESRAHAAGAGEPAWPMDAMAGVMSKMMATHCGQTSPAKPPEVPEERTTVATTAGEGCPCASEGA